jgi:hypothetical protein
MNPVRDALYDRLAAAGALTALLSTSTAIHHRRAPLNAITPFVVFDKSSGIPTWAMSSQKRIETDVWLVKGVTRGSNASLAEDIAEQIDVALTDADLVIGNHWHLFLRKQADVEYGEPDATEMYHHVGGMYRLVTQRQ